MKLFITHKRDPWCSSRPTASTMRTIVNTQFRRT